MFSNVGQIHHFRVVTPYCAASVVVGCIDVLRTCSFPRSPSDIAILDPAMVKGDDRRIFECQAIVIRLALQISPNVDRQFKRSTHSRLHPSRNTAQPLWRDSSVCFGRAGRLDIIAGAIGQRVEMRRQARGRDGRKGRGGGLGFGRRFLRRAAHLHDDVDDVGHVRRRRMCQTASKVDPGSASNFGSDSFSLQMGGDLSLFSIRNQRDGSGSSAFEACTVRFCRHPV